MCPFAARSLPAFDVRWIAIAPFAASFLIAAVQAGQAASETADEDYEGKRTGARI